MAKDTLSVEEQLEKILDEIEKDVDANWDALRKYRSIYKQKLNKVAALARQETIQAMESLPKGVYIGKDCCTGKYKAKQFEFHSQEDPGTHESFIGDTAIEAAEKMRKHLSSLKEIKE